MIKDDNYTKWTLCLSTIVNIVFPSHSCKRTFTLPGGQKWKGELLLILLSKIWLNYVYHLTFMYNLESNYIFLYKQQQQQEQKKK